MFYKKIKIKAEDIFKNKIELADLSKEVLRKNPGMMLYPIIGAVISIVAFVLLIMITKGSGAVVFALLLWYLILNILITFSNSASVICTKKYLTNVKPSFSDGFGGAFKKTNLIINWSLFNSIIGLFVNTLSELKLAKKFSYSGDIPWSLVSYFIVPVMISENKNVKDSVDESQKIIKKNWGRNVSGDYKFSFISMVPFLIVLLALIFSSVLKDEFVTYGLFVLTIFVLIIGFFMNFSLRTIFYTSIYLNIKGKVKK